MKKIVALVLMASLVLCGTALASGYIGGDGWWDDRYAGLQLMIENGDMSFRVPSGWSYEYYDGVLSCTRPDGAQYAVVRWLDQSFWDSVSVIDENAQWGIYEECAWLILKQDRDWYVGASRNYVDAICPGDLGGTIWVTVVMDGYASDWTMARRMISSVSSLEQY